MPSTTDLFNRAAQRYRASGRFAFHFARGKLSGDPAFTHLLESGALAAIQHGVLDIGCGQGLLAALLQAASIDVPYTGIELMANDVARARKALADLPSARFIEGDMCAEAFPTSDCVVILDVLHYVDFPAQTDVLQRVFQSLVSGGVLHLRIGDQAAGLPFKISNWVDAVVTTIRGHRLSTLYCRPLADWQRLLAELGFKVDTLPMHAGTPFANILLTARKP